MSDDRWLRAMASQLTVQFGIPMQRQFCPDPRELGACLPFNLKSGMRVNGTGLFGREGHAFASDYLAGRVGMV